METWRGRFHYRRLHMRLIRLVLPNTAFESGHAVKQCRFCSHLLRRTAHLSRWAAIGDDCEEVRP